MEKFSTFLRNHPLYRELELSAAERAELIQAEEDYLVDFFTTVINEAEEIMGIDPRQPLRTILEMAAGRIVASLNAGPASIRIFDAKNMKMLNFGGAGLGDYERLAAVPVEDSISGEVVSRNISIKVPSILKDPRYKNKEVVYQKGFHSLLAVPLRIPRFMDPASDFLGSLQIYYPEEDRQFDSLELILAEMLARRVSYVIAKKKILDLQELNERKEKIVNKIYVKLSNREGIKLRDLFLLLFPELGEFLQVQSCSLFTVTEDQQYIHLEAAYPLDLSYHELSYTFTIKHHPYFIAAIQGEGGRGDRPHERIEENYILIKEPRQSTLSSKGMRDFAERNQIHSILLVPLRVDGKVRHLLTFYAIEQKEFFTDEEIELLTFFGKEIMKASRLEYLGDVLHDIKNPAIAIAGFASRATRLLDTEDLTRARDKLKSYLEIMAQEASRLQDLALTMTGEGREEIVDLSQKARERFLLNEEVIRESKRTVRIMPLELAPDLLVSCPPSALERVLDNLLNNATKAIPASGGILAMRCYREEDFACLELTNTGEIPPGMLEEARQGRGKGRGLHIIYRFVQTSHGRMGVKTGEGLTTFLIKLPLQTEVLANRMRV